MSMQFVAALEAEMEALRNALSQDLRYVRLREIERLRELYRDPHDATNGANPAVAPAGTNEVRQTYKPPVRKASPERAQAMEAARLYVLNRAGPVPTVDVHEHLVGLGITIRGENPVNNLSAMLSNSGLFRANGRAGWTIKQSGDGDDPDEDVETSQHDENHVQPDERIAEAVRAFESVRLIEPPEPLDDELPPMAPRPVMYR